MWTTPSSFSPSCFLTSCSSEIQSWFTSNVLELNTHICVYKEAHSDHPYQNFPLTAQCSHPQQLFKDIWLKFNFFLWTKYLWILIKRLLVCQWTFLKPSAATTTLSYFSSAKSCCIHDKVLCCIRKQIHFNKYGMLLQMHVKCGSFHRKITMIKTRMERAATFTHLSSVTAISAAGH